jgi:CHASE2 domain-containing sensor protein
MEGPMQRLHQLKNAYLAGIGRFGLRERWKSLRPINRHWLINIAIGVAIEILVHSMHLVSVENWAMDRMMRIHALVDPAPMKGRTPPLQVFVDVDDATWRSKEWGGGEPIRAPREQMLKLIETAFTHGSTQVVLDIAVEGNNSARPEERGEDRKFSEGLKKLLDNEHFGADKQLVLVRSIRYPLPQLALDDGNTPKVLPYPALSEIRESPFVDEVVNQSNGRIVVAAPYFAYSSDRVLRDWRLFKVVCQREEQGPGGALRIVPSVQLLVATRSFGMPADKMSWQANAVCSPFPRQELAALPAAVELERLKAVTDKQEHDESVRYWEALRAVVLKDTGRDLGEAFKADALFNRVVFRSGAEFQSDQYFNRVSARLLLQGGADESRLNHLFAGRVTVVGQSFAEAGDQHYTPMGLLPGSVVLLNAIDSMVRYPLVQKPSCWKSLPLVGLLIVFVGYVFARWNSAWGPLISTAIGVPMLAVLSFYLFTHGVWLDFALPVIGILAHREFKSFEERRELRKLERLAGVGHSH